MTSKSYSDLIAAKRVAFEPRGFTGVPALHPSLFPHQQHAIEFALRAGSAGCFLATGLGKTRIALEWARVVVHNTNRSVMVLAPLAVGPQHAREAAKMGIDATYVREPSKINRTGIWITNYERLSKFDLSDFSGVVIDESSILKSYAGATSRAIIETFAETPFRLSCSATPAPNAHIELGQQCEFLGVMEQSMMLQRWFINDTKTASKDWRLKKHAVSSFWDWVASWSRCMSKPSDIGFSDAGFDLPELELHHHVVDADRSVATGAEKDGQARLFRIPDTSATSIHTEKRMTTEARADAIAAVVEADFSEPWIVWVNTDQEADAMIARIPGSVEVRGSMSADMKEERIVAFSEGSIRHLVTKARIAGHGLNWQHCARQAFIGLDFSFEAFHQAVRRSWRFGQTRPVHVHVAMADTEKSIWDVVSRKAGDHEMMQNEMRAAMTRAVKSIEKSDYVPSQTISIPQWLKVG